MIATRKAQGFAQADFPVFLAVQARLDLDQLSRSPAMLIACEAPDL
jgi:hypothetical protein